MGLHFADPSTSLSLLPNTTTTNDPPHAALAQQHKDKAPPVDFAAIVLVAPFTSLPTLLETYRIFGLIPVLSPIRGYPRFVNYLRSRIVDPWPTATRVNALVDAAATSSTAGKRRYLRLHVIHAKDDFDIPWAHGQNLYDGASAAVVERVGDGDVEVEDVAVRADGKNQLTGRVRRTATGDGGVEVRMDLLPFGGHNRVVTFAPVALAVRRAFDAAAARKA